MTQVMVEIDDNLMVAAREELGEEATEHELVARALTWMNTRIRQIAFIRWAAETNAFMSDDEIAVERAALATASDEAFAAEQQALRASA